MSTITTPMPTPPDNFSTQISSATVSPTALTFTVDDASGLPQEGVGVLFKKDSDGDVVAGSIEFIHWTSVSSNTINLSDTDDRGLTGSDSGAQSYVADDWFEVWVSSYYYDSQYDAFVAEHNTDGTHGAITPTSVTSAGAVIGDTVNVTGTGTSNVLTDSMARQAIMNGNFDIWQRGTGPITTTGDIISADRWSHNSGGSGGSFPTRTATRQAITPGAIANAFYHHRASFDGAGTIVADALFGLRQRIEFGTRFLCGDSKKVTLSFWAKSDLADKKIGAYLVQSYGTGGSPTSSEIINGENFTLTSSWQKFTHTFTTNTLDSKTFGTDNNDYLELDLLYAWGTDIDTRVGDTVAEDFGGSGFVDIAQVQLCAGDVALPFQPKSVAQELADCQRYYYRKTATQAYGRFAIGQCSSATVATIFVQHPTTMRTTPTFGHSGNKAVSNAGFSVVAVTNLALTSNSSNPDACQLDATVAAGLTAGDATQLFANNSTGSYIEFIAEL